MIVLEWLETPACVFDWIGPSDTLPPLRSPSGVIVAAVVGPRGPAGPQGEPGEGGSGSGEPGPAGPQGEPGPQGPQGIQGPSGPQGPKGDDGERGAAGPQGAPGLDGATGPAGAQGEAGPAGPAGPQGPQGVRGEAGPAGPAGPVGPQGPAGADGAVGPAGADGEDGAVGAQGPQGIRGEPGSAGATGPTGATGPQGIQGPKGDPGDTGPPGPTGPAGADGEDGTPGAAGATGPAGPAGATGATGPSGPAGADGAPGIGVPAGGTAGQVLTKASGADFATSWQTPSGGGGGGSDFADPSIAQAIWDDFLGGSLETGEIGWLGFSFANGSVAAINGGVTGRPGVIRRSSGASANQVASFFLGNAGGQAIAQFGDLDDVTWIVSPTTAGSDFTLRVGWFDDATTLGNPQGAHFERLSTDTNWFAKTCTSGPSATRTDTGVALVAGSWFKLRVRRISNTSYGFTINGGSEIVLSANTPASTTGANPGVQIIPTTTTTRIVDIDFMSMRLRAISR